MCDQNFARKKKKKKLMDMYLHWTKSNSPTILC